VDAVDAATHRALREALPDVPLIQVVHVVDEGAIEVALEVAERVDALLLDSGNPNLERKELGGTGRTHDWSISSAIEERSPVPVFLAGGLNPQNVNVAIEQVRPFGLDLCSGVRTEGALDPQKLARFMELVVKYED
jgi:phosphoribosylanthranilate isomerase